MSREHIHFVTGRLAEASLREVVAPLAARLGFDYSIDVLPITVAALMTPKWIAGRIAVPKAATRIVVTGYCEGDFSPLSEATAVRVERGPRDLRRLPEYLGDPSAAASRASSPDDYGAFDIEIVAEINFAPRLARNELLAEASRLAADGADVIDLGCAPGETWSGVSDAVRALKDVGLRVSIDSLNIDEIAPAVAAGAELVLSVNASNRHAAPDWGCEVVVIPDAPGTLEGLDESFDDLSKKNVRMRLDPILEPIGFGFARSLGRYLEVRRRWPEAEMLMGIGNLTELTGADSAPINVVLLGFCQELGVRSVLTTEAISWTRSSVRECDLARRLVHYAVSHRTLPKHLEPRLVMLRDAESAILQGDEALAKLAEQIKDDNYRLFAERGALHLLNGHVRLSDGDPFALFDKLRATDPKNLDSAHAFYLGFELAKASIALALGKEYRQDEALDWGLLTVEERSHRIGKKPRPPVENKGDGE